MPWTSRYRRRHPRRAQIRGPAGGDAGDRRLRRPDRRDGRDDPRRGGALCGRGAGAAQPDRRPAGVAFDRRHGDDARRALTTPTAAGWTPAGTGSARRPSGAARPAGRRADGRPGNLERRQPRLRGRPDAHRRRRRGARPPTPIDALKARLSAAARLRRMDGDHEPDRAAGGIGPRRDPHARRAGGGRHLPPLRPEDLHHLWRARPRRQHRPPGARPAAGRARRHARASRCSWCRRSCRTARRNDVVAAGIEEKLGLHGSPTCTMVYGERGEGAIGWLVGEENQGLAACSR